MSNGDWLVCSTFANGIRANLPSLHDRKRDIELRKEKIVPYIADPWGYKHEQ